MVKTALNSNLLRSDSSAPDYQEIRTSSQIVSFGNQHLATPRSGAELTRRIFTDLPPETVLTRKSVDKQDPMDSKTLSGISNVYEVICQVKHCKICKC